MSASKVHSSHSSSLQSSASERLQLAQSVLWAPNHITEATLHKVFAEMFTHKLHFADLYFQASEFESWVIDEGIVKNGSYSAEQGVGVRAVSGEKSALAYTDDIHSKAILEAAKSARAIAATGQSGRTALKTKNGFAPIGGHALYGAISPLAGLSADDKVSLLRRLDAMARKKDKRVTLVTASLALLHDVMLVARSDGHMAGDIRPLVRVNVTVQVEEKGRREKGSAGGGGRYALSDLSEATLARFVDMAVHEALQNLHAKPAPAGEQVVVLGPGWPGVMLHEAIGHGLEGDFNRKGSSAFAGKIGQQVAAKGVTVVDDGTLDGRRGSLNVDDEGNPTQCTVLIENGILKGYMQDMTNARLMKTALTGNGRRESYAHLPMPRMTNTYMLNGQHPPEEILASVKSGIYAVNFAGGQVDITSGKFVFAASLAYKIENGKLAYPVKGATIIGNGPDALTKITMMGNDMALDDGVGVCGKDGQSVPVGVGQPTLKMETLVVGGTATA